MTGPEESIQSGPLQITTLPESDWFLTSLVDFINKHHNEVPVTLLVNGVLVSGLLCCYEKYFEAVGLDTQKLFGEEEFPKSKANGGASETALPIFIHVKEARFFSGSQALPKGKGLWWRGRISEISGFSFGRLKE
jgi:hypothetical protein